MRLADGVEFVPGMTVWLPMYFNYVFQPPQKYKTDPEKDAVGYACATPIDEVYSTAAGACACAWESHLAEEREMLQDTAKAMNAWLKKNEENSNA